MNGLIIKVLSISIAVVTVVYLIIYKGNTMITKIFSVCIIAAMVIYWIVYERNTRKRCQHIFGSLPRLNAKRQPKDIF